MRRSRFKIPSRLGIGALLIVFILICKIIAQTPAQTLENRLQENPPPQPLPVVRMMLAGEYFDLEIATTQEALLRGLMYRNSVPARHGMLFPFYPPRSVAFWMKNTRVPLDMLFIRNKAVVNIVASAPPCLKDPCPNYDSVLPVDMVVELPGGTAQQYGIDFGDAIMLLPQNAAVPPGAAGPSEQQKPVDVFPPENKKPPEQSEETK